MLGYLWRVQEDLQVRYLRLYDQHTERIASDLVGFDKEAFNRPLKHGLNPDAEAWTPGQVVAHLLLAERGTLQLMQRAGHIEPGRAADAQCGVIEQRLLNSDLVLSASDRLMPPLQNYKLADSLDELMDSRAEIRVALDFADDPAILADAYDHPVLGVLTVLEWLHFTALHGERHRRQIKRG